MLEGCVQPSLAPNIDAAMARVLDRIGSLGDARSGGGGCCGALPYHLSEHDEARALARRNIDAWWPHIERGAEAIVVTASGCGVMVRDYGHLLAQRRAVCAQGRAHRGARARPGRVVGAEWMDAHRAARRAWIVALR